MAALGSVLGLREMILTQDHLLPSIPIRELGKKISALVKRSESLLPCSSSTHNIYVTELQGQVIREQLEAEIQGCYFPFARFGTSFSTVKRQGISGAL